MRQETCCCHMDYSFRLTARVLLYAPSHRIAHTMAFVIPVVEHWLEREIAQWVHCMNDCSLCGKNISSWCDGLSDQSFIVNPLSYFWFLPVLHNWCTNSCGICYPVYGMVHIKALLLLIGKNSPYRGGSRFPLLLSKWSFTIYPMPYSRMC